MDKIRIVGGIPLNGTIRISGAKNAALPLMTASLLTEETLALSNMPYLADITTMAKLLAQHGVHMNTLDGAKSNDDNDHFSRVLELHAHNITSKKAPYELVCTMRASVLVLGPLLARFGEAEVSLPGGCAIGSRPVDIHLSALEQMGAHIELKDGYVHAHSKGKLQGADITFSQVSVGATENILMAATLAEGTTQLTNAAREPEITDLAECLVKMGAKIEGIGTANLTIHGVDALHGAEHAVIPDRIETGSFIAAAALTNGEVELIDAQESHNRSVIALLQKAGVDIHTTERGLKVKGDRSKLEAVSVTTEPFPGFPTDMQAQLMALLTMASGVSIVTETIFENRFMHVPELTRMGADITIQDKSAIIKGVSSLRGAEVMATDLRASLSLVIAALAAEGESVIHRVYHLDRGYERIEEKLGACGAKIERIA